MEHYRSLGGAMELENPDKLFFTLNLLGGIFFFGGGEEGYPTSIHAKNHNSKLIISILKKFSFFSNI